MEAKISLKDLAELDDYLDSIRGDISPEEYDARKAVVRNAFAEELANCIPLSLAFSRGFEQEHFLGLLKKYPHDLHDAIRRAALLYKKELTFYDPEWNGFFDPKEILKAAERLRQQDQSIRGQKDRPGAESQIRKQIIVAMQKFCIGNEDRTLNDFIEAAQARSIEGLMMEPPYTFVLIHDEGEASKAYKFRGLRDLWTEARKNTLR